MTEKNITTKIVVSSYNELNDDEKKLVDLAKEATKNSYAPYSNFNVGAALQLENGVLIKGANQENAAFSTTICAERSALFNAGANYPGVGIKRLAVTAYTCGAFLEEPCAPCGECRQAMIEFEKQAGYPMEVYLVGAEKIYVLSSASDLLPLTFVDFK